jgi:hypothetical protein
MAKVDKGYLHEAMDRTSIITNNLEDYVAKNKAVKNIPKAKQKIREAINALAEAYKELGQHM